METRVVGQRYVEVEGLGTEIENCSDQQAEWFAVEQQTDGRWLTVNDNFATRAEAASYVVLSERLELLERAARLAGFEVERIAANPPATSIGNWLRVSVGPAHDRDGTLCYFTCGASIADASHTFRADADVETLARKAAAVISAHRAITLRAVTP